MKFCLFLTLVALAAAAPKPRSRDEARQMYADCKKRYSVPDEIVQKGKYSEYPPIEVMDTILCFLRHVDWWNDTTGFQTNNIMKEIEKIPDDLGFNKQKLREDFENCLHSKGEGETIQEWAHRDVKCFIDHKKLWQAIQQVKFYQEEKE